MSMYSFYGGKQGRTYDLVAHYDSIKDMVDLFQKGGSYVDANYNEYVIIDTLVNKNEKYNRENGIIFRRGLNYNEPFNRQPIEGYYVNDDNTITENDTESKTLIAAALDIVYEDYNAPTTGSYRVTAQVPKYKHYEYKISRVDGVLAADVRFKDLKREDDREVVTLYGEAGVKYTDTDPGESGGGALSWTGYVPKYTHYSYVLVDNAGDTNAAITALKDKDEAPLTIFARVWGEFVLNPGGGAVYVGQIVGPEGDSPEVELIDWTSFQDEYVHGDNVDAAKGELRASRQAGYVEGEGFYDDIQYGYCNLRDAQGNIVGAKIGFDFPYTVFNYTAESVSAYGPDVIEVQTLPSTKPANPKAYYKVGNDYYLWDETRKIIDNTVYPVTYIDDPGFVKTEIWAAEADGEGGYNYTNIMREYADSQGHTFYKDYQMFIPRGIHGIDFEDCDVTNDFELRYRLRDYSSDQNNKETGTVGDYISLGRLKVVKQITPDISVVDQAERSYLVVTYYTLVDPEHPETSANVTESIAIPTISHIRLESDGNVYAYYTSGTTDLPRQTVGRLQVVEDIYFNSDQHFVLQYNTETEIAGVRDTKTLPIQVASVVDTYVSNENQLDEVSYWYNKYDVIPDGESSANVRISETPVNNIVAIRNVGDTLVILYSDPVYRQGLTTGNYQLLEPTLEELRIKDGVYWTYEQDDTGTSRTTGGQFKWTTMGSIFTSNHLFGNFTTEAILKAQKPYGFGYNADGTVNPTETHALGWVTSVGDTSTSTTLTIYGYDYNNVNAHFVFDSQGNITSPAASVAQNNWYAISSFETSGIDPSQAVIKDYANANGTPVDTNKAANLQNKGFWFKIVNIPVAEDAL